MAACRKYSKAALTATFTEIHEKLDLGGEVALERTQWLKAQANDWAAIWMWPSIICFVVLAIFAIGFRDEPVEEEK